MHHLARRLAAALVLGLALAGPAPHHALGQGSTVYQNGTVVPNHLAKFVTNGRIVDVGGILGDANGLGVSPFAITDNKGPGLCTYSAATTGAYNALCLGHDGDGNPLISVESGGGQAPKSLNFSINGIVYTFPPPAGPGGGSGNVLGPTSSTIDEPAIWNNTAGTLLKDGLGVSIKHTGNFTDTGNVSVVGLTKATDNKSAAFSSALAGYSGQFSSYEPYAIGGAQVNSTYITSCIYDSAPNCSWVNDSMYDVVRAVAVLPTGSTNGTSGSGGSGSFGQMSGFGAYAVNQAAATTGGFPNTSQFSGFGVAAVDGALNWGLTIICTDNLGQVVTNNGSVKARACNNEISFNITSPHDIASGLFLDGGSLAQPAFASGFTVYCLDGFNCSVGGAVAKWNWAFGSAPGATAVFANIAAQEPAATFTGTIAGTTLTASCPCTGIIVPGAFVNGTGVTLGTYITARGTGTGVAGTYTVSVSQTVASTAMNLGAGSQALKFNALSIAGALSTSTIQSDPYGELQVSAPTGGRVVLGANFADTLMVGSAVPFGLANGNGYIVDNTTNGSMHGGKGSFYDVSLANSAGAVAVGVTAGTTNVFVAGSLAVEGMAATTVGLYNVCYNAGNFILTYEASFTTCPSSSMRYKRDWKPIEPEAALAEVTQYRPGTFIYKDDPKGYMQGGFLAEDMAEASPDMVVLDDQGRPEKIQTTGIIAKLAAAIQAQQREIDALRRTSK